MFPNPVLSLFTSGGFSPRGGFPPQPRLPRGQTAPSQGGTVGTKPPPQAPPQAPPQGQPPPPTQQPPPIGEALQTPFRFPPHGGIAGYNPDEGRMYGLPGAPSTSDMHREIMSQLPQGMPPGMPDTGPGGRGGMGSYDLSQSPTEARQTANPSAAVLFNQIIRGMNAGDPNAARSIAERFQNQGVPAQFMEGRGANDLIYIPGIGAVDVVKNRAFLQGRAGPGSQEFQFHPEAGIGDERYGPAANPMAAIQQALMQIPSWGGMSRATAAPNAAPTSSNREAILQALMEQVKPIRRY